MIKTFKTGFNINPSDLTINYTYNKYDIEFDGFLNKEDADIVKKQIKELYVQSTLVDLKVARFLQENPLYRLKDNVGGK